MRRAVVLAIFVLSTFLPRLMAGDRGHLSLGFAGADGKWSFSGLVPSMGGEGPRSPIRLSLNVLSGRFRADLGGPVDPGSLHVKIAWSTTWFDRSGKPHEGAKGSFSDAETHLYIDPKKGRVWGHSAAMSMRGPTLNRGGCGMGREARADHTIEFSRHGRRYRLFVSVGYTRRGHRIITVDAGNGP